MGQMINPPSSSLLFKHQERALGNEANSHVESQLQGRNDGPGAFSHPDERGAVVLQFTAC